LVASRFATKIVPIVQRWKKNNCRQFNGFFFGDVVKDFSAALLQGVGEARFKTSVRAGIWTQLDMNTPSVSWELPVDWSAPGNF